MGTLCACGCGEPALYAERHVRNTLREKKKLGQWVEQNMGYDTPCWIWTGARCNASGRSQQYGRVYLRGRYQKAHRAVFQNVHGELPEGIVLHHLCEIHLCVNPKHLQPEPKRTHDLRPKSHHGVQSINTAT